MKNLLILIVICAVAWQFYFKDSAVVETVHKKVVSEFSNSDAMKTLARAGEIANPKTTYRCDGRQYCSQMRSYDEAKYFIRYCPNTKMDGDGDGIPCERQFNK
ncbi:excalibur calcium-binding domain-containing protein [Marinomonas sp. TW1]|uniref:excalibur calcium-binding domain-containing protein n=1 Tax=Marinomonas sp. TW1 TaxID=1561203 RepID=UPI0007AF34E9|nr:excalibur calcium-binding domain-containing protein [Marinomonas sp. TW1]KZN12678.1 hypothetical protein OA79_14535 [Marinomonas sp. TW1]